jgi:hypothetical protein
MGSKWDDLLMKHCHLDSRSRGSNWDNWLMKHCHLRARNMGRKGIKFRVMKFRPLVAGIRVEYEDWVMKHRHILLGVRAVIGMPHSYNIAT